MQVEFNEDRSEVSITLKMPAGERREWHDRVVNAVNDLASIDIDERQCFVRRFLWRNEDGVWMCDQHASPLFDFQRSYINPMERAMEQAVDRRAENAP